MGKKRKVEKNESSAVKEGLDWLLAERNRGTLLDVVVFVLNLFLMRLLVGYFLDVASLASNGDAIAQAAMFLFCVSLFVLPPAGAVMKRWHFHKRRGGNQPKESALSGCLFNPIFYFCLTAVIFSAVNAFILQFFSKGGDPGATVFITSIFIGIGLMITHTWLVYRYFTPPKTEPRSEFLRSPASELAGDICIFVNMINFQIIWNLLSFSGLPHPTGPFDVIARIFVLCFIALLIYFPPRMFYLAEDIDKGRTWLMILLANAPVIIRVVIGTGDASDWQ
jgi:predicted permease